MGSQHKCVERPVQLVFLDYLSVSCDYATTVLNTKMKEVGNKITDLMGDKKNLVENVKIL